LDGKLQNLVTLLGPVLLAIFVVGSLKHSSHGTPAKSEQLAKVLELIASILLPLIVLNIVRRTEIVNALWWTFVIGFLLPIVVYFVVSAIATLKLFSGVFSSEKPINRLLLSSFGGGNRGNLLILTTFGAQATIGPDVIKHFVVLDLGNLMCLLTLGFWLVGRLTKASTDLRLSEMVETLFKNPGTYAAILIFLQLPGLRETNIAKLITSFDLILKATGPFLNALFSFCIFLAIFVRIDRLSEVLKDAWDVILSFMCSRIAAALGITALLMAFQLQRELLVATAVLALMPPSSFLWTRISQAVPNIPPPSKRKAIYLVPNFFYFALLGGALLWGLL
jgi:hypothetical protein